MVMSGQFHTSDALQYQQINNESLPQQCREYTKDSSLNQRCKTLEQNQKTKSVLDRQSKIMPTVYCLVLV
jgi:hypothetical protein